MDTLVYTTETDSTSVPRGETDKAWYLAAAALAPDWLGSTERRSWTEGFVAGLEAARERTVVGAVLRETLGMTETFAVAVRKPSPFKADAESLARFMFERQAVAMDAEPDEIEDAWLDPGVHEFWLSEASAVLRFLP
jgi:hypothetical protein